MKLYKTLFLLSLFLMSCSSNDDGSNDDIEINTEVEITISGEDIGTFNFDDLDFSVAQQCAEFELYSNSTFQNESISVGYFLLQLDDVQSFWYNNPNDTYTYDGLPIRDFFNQINTMAEINSEIYIATYITIDLTSRFHDDVAICGDFFWQVFDINFTVTLEHSNGTLAPITITGNTIYLPIVHIFAC